jgi:hypothetical protein
VLAIGDGRERTGERNVVDVVTSHLRERPGLPPASHSAEYEARIARQERSGTEAQAFHDPRPETFDDDVGSIAQFQRRVSSLVGSNVDLQNVPPAVDNGVWPAVSARPIDPDNFGAEIRQEHAAVRARAYAREFQDAHTRQGPGSASFGHDDPSIGLPVRSWTIPTVGVIIPKLALEAILHRTIRKLGQTGP